MKHFIIAKEHIVLDSGRRLMKGGSYALTDAELVEAGTRIRSANRPYRDKAVHAEALSRTVRARKKG